ncbi:MAG TPA: branched-chain amino acid transport system II carrier protein, partial [Waddliaceae bacterium]
EEEISKALPVVFRGSMIGMTILAAVYICLISLAAHFAPFLQGIPKDQLLAHLAQHILGPTWSVIALATIFLACFSTSIALIIAYTDFLHEQVFQLQFNSSVAMLIALTVAFVMSLFGLEGITFITAPVLKVGYPILIMLIVYNVGKMIILRRLTQRVSGLNR